MNSKSQTVTRDGLRINTRFLRMESVTKIVDTSDDNCSGRATSRSDRNVYSCEFINLKYSKKLNYKKQYKKCNFLLVERTD